MEVELRNFPVPIEYWVEEYPYCNKVTIAVKTKDRDTGGEMKLYLYFSYDRERYPKVEAIRTALIEAMTHEIDECLYVDGDRIFDPHVPEKLHR